MSRDYKLVIEKRIAITATHREPLVGGQVQYRQILLSNDLRMAPTLLIRQNSMQFTVTGGRIRKIVR